MPAAAPGPTLPATGEGRRFVLHAFVCLNETACLKDGPATEIHKLLKQRVKDAGLKQDVRINKSGCLDQCGHGPTMVVYPEGVWYSHLDLDDAARIFDEHIVGGQPVEDLLHRTREPGKNVLPMKDPEARVVDTTSAYYSPCARCPHGDGAPAVPVAE